MKINTFNQWARAFTKEAKADDFALFHSHLKRVDLIDEPEKLLKGTIMVAAACCAYLEVDNQDINSFLLRQTYKVPNGDENYFFTFNLFDKLYGRIISPVTMKDVDLADLYGHPWNELKMCGYMDVRVSKTDGRNLSKDEINKLKEAIIDDIRFDYTEDDVDIWLISDWIKGVLVAQVADVLEET